MTKSSLTSAALVLFVLAIQASSVYTEIDKKGFCYSLSPIPESFYKVTYQTMDPEAKILVTITNQQEKLQFTESSKQVKVSASSLIEVCYSLVGTKER